MRLRSPPSRSVEELHGCIIVWTTGPGCKFQLTEAPSTAPHCCPLAESLRLLLCRTSIPSIFGAGAAWSIRGLLSTLLNAIPASGGQKFHVPAENLSLRAARIWQFVTGVDATTAPAALLMALEAIDAGAFARAAPLVPRYRVGTPQDCRRAVRPHSTRRNSFDQSCQLGHQTI